jgi:alanine-synthesizing transaminase
MKPIARSEKLHGICYDIRGPVLDEAKRLEEEGQQILKLNIGNPAPFGFDAPDDILKDVIHNLPSAQGYSDSNGIYSAKVAVHQYYQTMSIENISVDDIYLGNGVSELIMMSMQALLNSGDEVLIPSPDYPLWTAAVKLSSGNPVHYLCDESSDWFPDIDDIKKKISSRTRAIVLINPNNPTGAVYSKALLESIVDIAREHQLIILSDEIYDKILYEEAEHISIASLCDDVLCVTFSGLSKNYRVAGFRVGWMLLSGPMQNARDYLQGLNMLSSMRLCANVPMQHAVQTALGGFQSIEQLVSKGGRLEQQMNLSFKLLNEIPGISCVKPKGALYLFPKIDIKKFNIHDDEQFIFDFLKQKKVLMVHGRGFNWHQPDHFRLVFLPHVEQLTQAIHSLSDFLLNYKQETRW